MALLSLRMLLEAPNPKDPQDAEVAKMMMEDKDYFESKAHDWAVTYAGAPRRIPQPKSYMRKTIEKTQEDPTRHVEPRAAPVLTVQTLILSNRYQGYHKDLINRFVNMGFELDAVVDAFNFVGIDRNGGEDYELEEAYMGDITARLLGEQ
jgi:ubiquitin-conjugating enzyme (huntingtin interacting protein 2)